MIRVAVMGYGTIGSGVVEVLDINKNSIAKRAGEEIGVKYILDLRDFPGDPIQEKVVHDYKVIANDPEVQIVVETMGGVEPAYTFVKAMLEAGKHVTTSNKALVAAKGAELIALAKEKNVNFMFEASVGGGIPIIRPLNSCLTADESGDHRNCERNHELYADENDRGGIGVRRCVKGCAGEGLCGERPDR